MSPEASARQTIDVLRYAAGGFRMRTSPSGSVPNAEITLAGSAGVPAGSDHYTS